MPSEAIRTLDGLRRTRVVRRELREAIRLSLESSRPPVLVYQVAKVGSSTVTSALKSIDGLHVFQVHVLHPDNIRLVRSRLRVNRLALFETDSNILGHTVYKEIIQSGRPTKVVTLVRDPIARNVSYYFENLHLLWRTRAAHEHVALARLLEEFFVRFDHRDVLIWFDQEFKRVLEVDVYAYEFPRSAGCLRIDAGRHDILIMRTDMDDASKAKCLEEFVGVRGVSLLPRNVGAEKAYAVTYRKFLQTLKLPEAYVNEMLNSKYTRHFFTPGEIESLRARWLGKSRPKSPRLRT